MENSVENSSGGSDLKTGGGPLYSFLSWLVLALGGFLLLVVVMFLGALAWGIATLPGDWADREQAKDDCREMALATGFETKWKSYSFDNYECLVKLNVPEVEGVKWLPFDDVKIIVTNPVE